MTVSNERSDARTASPVAGAVVLGASGGIGRALAEALAEGGTARIHALSRSGDGPAGPPGPALRHGTLDLRDEASIEAAARQIAVEGPVDLVLVATGLLHGDGVSPEKTFRALDPTVLAEYFAVNATGPALVAKHFLPLLPKDRRAVFACLSARVGSIGDNRLGGWYGYRASKAALNMLVRTLSVELRRTHPKALCVGLHPGTVDTGLSAPFQRGVPVLKTPGEAARELLQVVGTLAPDDSGGCFAYDGSRIAP